MLHGAQNTHKNELTVGVHSFARNYSLVNNNSLKVMARNTFTLKDFMRQAALTVIGFLSFNLQRYATLRKFTTTQRNVA